MDDAVGETYDKVARVIGLSYPGGPMIDNLSKIGKDTLKIKKPKVEGYDFSFSGVKTFITNYVNHEKMKGNEIIKENIASSLQNVVVNILYDKVEKVIKEKQVNTILVAGGVSANRGLRKKFENFKEKGIEVHFPKMEYCTDNAAMIGCAAYYNLKKNEILEKSQVINSDALSTKEKKRL